MMPLVEGERGKGGGKLSPGGAAPRYYSLKLRVGESGHGNDPGNAAATDSQAGDGTDYQPARGWPAFAAVHRRAGRGGVRGARPTAWSHGTRRVSQRAAPPAGCRGRFSGDV